jgi:hypothetical protein
LGFTELILAPDRVGTFNRKFTQNRIEMIGLSLPILSESRTIRKLAVKSANLE